MTESPDASLVLHYAPRTRSFTALWLLEELGVPYRLESFDLASGRQRSAEHLALNPMGKVPVVVDHGTPVSELGAIAIYLADRYPEAGLAPRLDEPARAAYLRWIFFATAVMEPAYAERFNKWEPQPLRNAWGSFDRMVAVATAGVSPGPFLLSPFLGERFTAADVVFASMVRFGLLFGALEKEGPLAAYVARATARDAFARASAIEAREGERFPRRV